MRSRVLLVKTGTKKGSSGRVSVEVLATMFLLLLLGIGVFSLAITSTSAYQRIYEGKSVSSNVRTALAYIEMRIRQNDIQGAVRIENNPVNNEPSLVITDEYESGTYETWVYFSGGKLREALMPEGEPPSDDLSLEIADLNSFSISSSGGLVHISVSGYYQGKEIRLDGSVLLRSGKED